LPIEVPGRALAKERQAISKITEWMPFIRVASGRGSHYSILQEKLAKRKMTDATAKDIAKEAFYVAYENLKANPFDEKANEIYRQALANIPAASRSSKKAEVRRLIGNIKSKTLTPEEKMIKAQPRKIQSEIRKGKI
jgi:hypothetical protein